MSYDPYPPLIGVGTVIMFSLGAFVCSQKVAQHVNRRFYRILIDGILCLAAGALAGATLSHLVPDFVFGSSGTRTRVALLGLLAVLGHLIYQSPGHNTYPESQSSHVTFKILALLLFMLGFYGTTFWLGAVR